MPNPTDRKIAANPADIERLRRHLEAPGALKAPSAEKTMREQKHDEMTLGDLIVAITDEVAPYIRDPAILHRVVSLVVADLVARDIVRLDDCARDLLAEEELIDDERVRRVGS